MKTVILKKGREKSLLRRHPWVFSGSVHSTPEKPEVGETVQVRSAKNTVLGVGSWSPSSQIRVRMWSFTPETEINSSFLRERIKAASDLRNIIIDRNHHTAYRVVNSESDGLPGLIVDRYNGFLVCQFLSAGAEYLKNEIVAVLNDVFEPEGIYERSDSSSRIKEGLNKTAGLLSGKEPPEYIEILEGDVGFLVDVYNGHKTGFYLDQRVNRELVGKYSGGEEVLNCFSYTGGFCVHALKGGALRVTNIESSEDHLFLTGKNVGLNGLDITKTENIQGDVFHVLRAFREEERKFGVIVLDPPKFASSGKQVDKAARGYKDIAMLAFQMLKPGGVLFTFSCSGHMETDLFGKIIADAALDAGREAHIIQSLHQAPDHTISLNFPESAYLKGLICRAL